LFFSGTEDLVTEKEAVLRRPLVEVSEEIHQQKRREEDSVLGKTALINAIPTLFRKVQPTMGDLIKIPMKVVADLDKVEFGIIQGLVGFITRNGVANKLWNWKKLTAVRKGSKKKSFKFQTVCMDHKSAAARSQGQGIYNDFCRFGKRTPAFAL